MTREEIDRLRADRRDLVEDRLRGTAAAAWSRLCSDFRDSPTIYPSSPVPTVWEGPGHQWLIPLEYELVTEFADRFGRDGATTVSQSIRSSNILESAYALLTLSLISPDVIKASLGELADQSGVIHTVDGSFGWEGSLHDYALRLLEDEQDVASGGM